MQKKHPKGCFHKWRRGRDYIALRLSCTGAHWLRQPAYLRLPFAGSRTLPPEFELCSTQRVQKKRPFQGVSFLNGGEAEIRTLGGVAPTTVFKTAALNRSATSPRLRVIFILNFSSRQVLFANNYS